MDYSGASAYIYAKACGMLSRAWVGKNAVHLFEAKSLSELWELIFGSSAPSLPEQLLANKIETEAVKRFVSQYTSLLALYSKPDKFLVELLRRYEVENIKVLAASISMGEHTIPRVINLGKYELLNYKAWPNLKKITEKSEFAWYDSVSSIQERAEQDYRLDLQEFRTLWKAVNRLGDSSRSALIKYYTEEYRIHNMLWALRLRVYYKMSDEQIISKLFYVTDKPSVEDPLCGPAIEILNKATDNWDDWKKWRYAEYLNPHEEGVVWNVDPMWIEQKLRIGETKRAKQVFHQYPMTYASLVMFFRIKQQELNCIRAAVEALRLNADKAEAMYVAGVESASNN